MVIVVGRDFFMNNLIEQQIMRALRNLDSDAKQAALSFILFQERKQAKERPQLRLVAGSDLARPRKF